jgi:NADH-quinone oxidoreductase subunit H
MNITENLLFLYNALFACIQSIIIIVFILISVAYFTLLERKVLAVIQRRQGPNVIGTFGLGQPISDGLKLLSKEVILPYNANKFLFKLAPTLAFALSLIGWGVIPFSHSSALADINVGMLIILAISSLGVYGIIISGWSSNSKYPFLGALRSSAQIVSYELPLGFSVINVILLAGSLRIDDIVYMQKNTWFVFPLLISAIVFFISSLAETSRHPFDLPEAESELVSGFNVEYSGMTFALFSLAEYTNILMMCALNTILFFGGWLPPLSCLSFIPESFWFGIKTTIFGVLFIYARALLPRYRYDQLMDLGWVILLPISIACLLVTITVLYGFDMYPINLA